MNLPRLFSAAPVAPVSPVVKASIILLGVLFLIFIREPAWLLAPRIWAEEGSIYIQSYLDNGFLGSIFKPHIGYYSLFSNLSVAFSTALFGLQWAAYGTTYLSLVFTVLCISAPFYLPGTYWDSTARKVLIVASSLLVSTPEIWLNTINVHFFLGLFACYFLLSDVNRIGGNTYILSLGILLLGALTSVTTVILMPLFAIRMFSLSTGSGLGTSKRFLLPVLILSVGLIIQIIALSSSLDTPAGGRLSVSSIVNYPAGLAETSLYIAYGNSRTLSALFALAITGMGVAGLVKAPGLRPIVFLIIYVSAVFTLLSLNMEGGGRYGYIPSVLIVLLFANLYKESGPGFSRVMVIGGAVFLLYKLQFYFDTEDFYDPDWNSFYVEYEESVGNNSDFVRVFPQWEGTGWRINTESTGQNQ